MKCKHTKKCKLYNDASNTCNKNGGVYYGDRTSNCYNNMELQNE